MAATTTTTMAIRDSDEEILPRVESVTRSRLHNFTFLPSAWGEQRLMRHVDQDSSEKKKFPDEKEKLSGIMENPEIPWNLRKKRACGKDDCCVSVVNGAKQGKRKLFSVSLSAKEIEADFLLMTRKKPQKRPKKRPKNVQKQIDDLFPGMWLSEITPDLYKVEEEEKL